MRKAFLLIALCLYSTTLSESNKMIVIKWSPLEIRFDYHGLPSKFMNLPLMKESTAPFGLCRGTNIETLGDYFFPPSAKYAAVEKTTIEGLVRAYNNSFKSPIPESLFYAVDWYDLNGSYLSDHKLPDTSRYEFFIRCTDGNAIYVLSGWLPNFIKLYKAIPRDYKLSLIGLKNEIDSLIISPAANSFAFDSIFEGNHYLYKGRSSNIIIKNYNISAHRPDRLVKGHPIESTPAMYSDWYNIIEITVYLNKEFMP